MSTQERLQSFFNQDDGDTNSKLESLKGTIESIEEEYKSRGKQRINDLQLIINNVYSSKGVLKYTRDHRKELSDSIKDINNKINEIDKKIDNLSSDLIVNGKRYKNLKLNVVGQADECHWEMDKLFKLLQNDNYSDEDEDDDKDETFKHLTETTDIGSLGLQLNKIKNQINQRNNDLYQFAQHFQRIRYGHSMQYHHINKEEYMFYRKNIDLENQEEKLYKKQLQSIKPTNNDHIGMLLDLDEK